MTESPDTGMTEPEETPHDDELDVEGPNESAPGHNPDENVDVERADEPGGSAA